MERFQASTRNIVIVKSSGLHCIIVGNNDFEVFDMDKNKKLFWTPRILAII